MNGWILVPITLALMAIAVIVARAMGTKERVSLEKPKAPEPTATVDEGTVARIGMASDKWGARVHIILEEKPGKPISLAIDTDESAFPLTQVGDRVRIERQDEEGEFYEFTNLTLGLTVTES
jgi:hypothetical protein